MSKVFLTENLILARIGFWSEEKQEIAPELSDAYALLYIDPQRRGAVCDPVRADGEPEYPVFGVTESGGILCDRRPQEGLCFVLTDKARQLSGFNHRYVTRGYLAEYMLNSDCFFYNRLSLLQNVTGIRRVRCFNTIRKDRQSFFALQEYLRVHRREEENMQFAKTLQTLNKGYYY